MNIKPGDSLLFKHSNLIGARIIRFFKQSIFHHSAIIINVNNCSGSNDITVDAIESRVFKGVHLSSYKLNSNKHSVYQVENLTDKDIYKIKETAFSLIGRKYDKMAILYLSYLTLTLGIRRPNKWDNKDMMFCAEVNDVCYKSIGIDVRPDIGSGNLAPGDIALSKDTVLVY